MSLELLVIGGVCSSQERPAEASDSLALEPFVAEPTLALSPWAGAKSTLDSLPELALMGSLW